MVSEAEKRELREIRKMTNEPKDEEKIVPLVDNSGQIKVAIPKRFSNSLELDCTKQKAKFTFLKKERKLIMEII